MKNVFSSIFDDVSRFLGSKGVHANTTLKPCACLDDIRVFNDTTKLDLPDSFAKFHTYFSNGYEFRWEGAGGMGLFSIPSLSELAVHRANWLEYVCQYADDPSSMDLCIKPQFRQRAFEIWKQMKLWVPFFDESEGDSFCLNTSNGEIVFNKHDWFDGFGEIAETNGLVAGSSLEDFVKNWALFSFEAMWFTDAPHTLENRYVEWGSGWTDFHRAHL